MMNMISNDTGGRAFYWNNAVGEATSEAVNEGSNYYTLAFVPAANRPGLAPVKPPYRRLMVDFAADPRDLSFTRNADGKLTARLRFVTLLYLPSGRLANRVSNVIDTTLTPAGYAALRSTGFTYRQEISLPARGDYSKCTGVQDLTSGRIGSVELDAGPLRLGSAA